MELDFTIASGYDSFLTNLDVPRFKGVHSIPAFILDFKAAEDVQYSSAEEDEPLALYSTYERLFTTTLKSSGSSRSATPDLTFDSDSREHKSVNPARFLQASACPKVAANLMRVLDYDSFLSLASTCRGLWDALFSSHEAIFAAYIPGYRATVTWRDNRYFNDVPVTLADFCRLMVSQNVTLDRFSAVALEKMTSPRMLENDRDVAYVQSLSLSHSKFVLLLQANVHSAATLPRMFYEVTEPLQSNIGGLRELVLPAPLMYEDQTVKTRPTLPSQPLKSRKIRRQRPLSDPGAVSLENRRASASSMSSGSLKSYIRGTISAPPSPSSSPAALDQYATWRCRASTRSLSAQSRRSASRSHNRTMSTSSRIALSVSYSTVSITSAKSGTVAGSIRGPQPLPAPDYSPHALNLAVSRVRAPILRVFVPCSDIDQQSISECAAQVSNGGLWDHLSTGDLVCNLGYIPWPDSPDPVFWLIFDGTALVHFRLRSPPPLSNVLSLPSPFYYAHILPLGENPILSITIPASEPSPVIKTSSTRPRALSVVEELHTESELGNYAAEGTDLSSPQVDFGAGFSLISISTNVLSPHSPHGKASAIQHVWTARYLAPTFVSELGEGWSGEWIIEGRGTKEGKIELEECIRGLGGEHIFECVKERSPPGRLWLRLLTSNSTPRIIDI